MVQIVAVDELCFAPLDDTGTQLLFRFEAWGRFLPEHTTGVSMLDRLLHHCPTVVVDGDSYRMKRARGNGGTRIKTN